MTVNQHGLIPFSINSSYVIKLRKIAHIYNIYNSRVVLNNKDTIINKEDNHVVHIIYVVHMVHLLIHIKINNVDNVHHNIIINTNALRDILIKVITISNNNIHHVYIKYENSHIIIYRISHVLSMDIHNHVDIIINKVVVIIHNNVIHVDKVVKLVKIKQVQVHF